MWIQMEFWVHFHALKSAMYMVKTSKLQPGCLIITQSLILTNIRATIEHDPEQNPFAWNPQNIFA